MLLEKFITTNIWHTYIYWLGQLFLFDKIKDSSIPTAIGQLDCRKLVIFGQNTTDTVEKNNIIRWLILKYDMYV